MLSRLSQLGKNLSDEITRINDEASSPNGKKQISQEQAVKIMNTTTPPLSKIVKPDHLNDTTTSLEKTDKSTKPIGLQNKSKKNTSVFPGTDIPLSSLPNEVVNMLHRYVKYKRLYPKLYEAYKIERTKLSIVQSFENALKENTPCSSIAEVGMFTDFLKASSSKDKLLQKQVSEKSANCTKLSAENKKLQAQVMKLNSENQCSIRKIKVLERKLGEATSKQMVDAAIDNELAQDVTIKLKSLKQQPSIDKTEKKTINEANDNNERLETLMKETATLKNELTHLKDTSDLDKKKKKDLTIALGKASKRNDDLVNKYKTENSQNELKFKQIIQQKNKDIKQLKEKMQNIQGDEGVRVKNQEKLLNNLEKARNMQRETSIKLSKLTAQNNEYVRRVSELNDKVGHINSLRTKQDLEITDLKHRIEEMSMQSHEYESKIDTMEEELSQMKSLLEERTLEAKTMRRIIGDKANSTDKDDKKVRNKLAETLREKSVLEDSLAFLQNKEIKRGESFNLKLKQLNENISKLEATNNNLKTQLNEMESQNEGTGIIMPLTSPEISKLRSQLDQSEIKIQGLRQRNKTLQLVNDDNSQKLIRLNKKLRQMSQQSRKSRSNSIISNESIPKSPKFTADSNEHAIYIRNVLFGFLEHKDRRNMLLPVIKALLLMSDEDEIKFTKLLGKA